MRNIRRIFFFGFIFIVSLLIAGNEIPNEVITENPKKEVTKIKSKKIKDKAELDIKVKKRTPIKVLGRARTDGKVMYLLEKPKDKAEKRVTYFVTENLQEIQNLNPKARARGVETTVEEEETDTVLTVSSDKKVYIAEIDGGKVRNIYIGEKQASKISVDNIQRDYVYIEALTNTPIKLNYRKTEGYWYSSTTKRWLDTVRTTDSQIVDIDEYYRATPSPNQVSNFTELNLRADTPLSQMQHLRGIGERYPNGPGWGGREPGSPYRYNSEGNYTAATPNSTWIRNMKSVELYLQGYSSMPVFITTVVGVSEGISDLNFKMPGIYEFRFQSELRFDDSGGPKIERWTYPVRMRNSKTVSISPKNDQIADMLNGKVMIAENGINGGQIPTDWRFRYNDRGEAAAQEWGLYIRCTDTSSFNITQKEKRRINVKKGSTFDMDVWLENVGGIAKLRYQVYKAIDPSGTLNVNIKVNHEAWARYLYQDTVSLNIPQRPEKEIGSASIEIDNRIYQVASGWISGDGYIYGSLTQAGEYYGELIKFTPAWQNLTGENIIDVQKIEGRPEVYGRHTTSDNKKMKHFLTASGGWEDESGAMYDFILSNINSYIRASISNKSSNPNLNNVFYLIGTNYVYKGNLIESYSGDRKPPSATAVLDAREELGANNWGRWIQNPTDGTLRHEINDKFKLTIDSGKMFKFLGMRSGNTMINRIEVQEGGKIEIVSGNAGHRIEIEKMV